MACRSLPRKVTYFEPVPPRLARNDPVLFAVRGDRSPNLGSPDLKAPALGSGGGNRLLQIAGQLRTDRAIVHENRIRTRRRQAKS